MIPIATMLAMFPIIVKFPKSVPPKSIPLVRIGMKALILYEEMVIF
jgi:hypothetical protein